MGQENGSEFPGTHQLLQGPSGIAGPEVGANRGIFQSVGEKVKKSLAAMADLRLNAGPSGTRGGAAR